MNPDELAQFFHETYEALAPEFQYKTRSRSAVPWDQVPEDNKALMVETARRVIEELQRRGCLVDTAATP